MLLELLHLKKSQTQSFFLAQIIVTDNKRTSFFLYLNSLLKVFNLSKLQEAIEKLKLNNMLQYDSHIW